MARTSNASSNKQKRNTNSMKTKELQDLLNFIANSELAEVEIETKEYKVSVRKYASSQAAPVAPAAPPAPAQASPAPAVPPAPASETPATSSGKTEESGNLITVKSPMIGTFYRASSPESDDFVNVGDEIKPGQTLCIVEAMKLFNEIESEVSGKIVKILVENATPVEYDQPLFLVEPA